MGERSRPTLQHRVHIRATPEEVWHALTDPSFTEQYYFGLAARSDWHRGARIVYESTGREPYFEGTVVEATPPHRLSLSIRLLRDADTASDLPSRVTWEIVATEGGCELTVVHDDFESETPTYRAVANGWPVALAGLVELLETGRAANAQSAWPEHIQRPKPL